MSFLRYPNYKDSSVEWLGAVPKHWEVKRLKRACQVFPSNVDKKSYENEMPVQLCNYTDVYKNNSIVAGMNFMSATATPDQIAKFTLRAGDTIITKDSETADDIAVGAYVPADIPGVICGYHLSMIRPMKVTDGAFVKVLFDSTYVKSCVAVRANGLTRVGLGQYEIDNLDLPFPPLPEQTQIAAFLDTETAKIDGLMAEQRRLMELLKEKRQAVISHAVTRGLNPDAPLKPSGIEWLGDVPAHWYVKRLKHNLRLLTEKTDRRDHPVALENIEGWTGRFIPTETEFEGEGIAFDAGDILFGKLRPYLAKAYRAASSGEAVGDFHVMRPHPDIDSRFAQYQILNREFIAIVDGSTFGSKMPRASWEFVGGMKVTTPPLPEQTQIAAFLDNEIAKFDTLTTEAQRAIDLLQERRTALISAAVTGQIDVREHV
jgi:type I restriction enzyme S subunit